MGEPESAQRELNALRERVGAAPDDAEAWYQLGSALDSAGHESEAIGAYERVFRLGIDHQAEDDHSIRRFHRSLRWYADHLDEGRARS